MSDYIYIKNAAISATVGKDCWHRDKSQPVLVSVRLRTSVKLAGNNDDVEQTINYGYVYKDLVSNFTDSKHTSLDQFTDQVCHTALKTSKSKQVHAAVTLPKGLLQASSLGYECSMSSVEGGDVNTTIDEGSRALLVNDLKLPTLIGVNPHERNDKQMVVINLRLEGGDGSKDADYQGYLKPFFEFVENATFLTLEAFCVTSAKLFIQKLGVLKVTILTQKPSAYAFMEMPGVELTRSKGDPDMA